ncbi:MAG: hypothetical protein HQ557_04055 [Bacteroidetes bacterium]|nr:hypothetical protein [Bacteroidota bacterium]
MKEEKYSYYKLFPFVISYTHEKIFASSYIYWENTNIIREISHPATINQENSILSIDQYISQGGNTSFCLKSFNDFISKAPDWDLTSFYLIKKGLHEYSNLLNCADSPFLKKLVKKAF